MRAQLQPSTRQARDTIAPLFVSTELVAELLGVHETTIRRRCYDDDLDYRYVQQDNGGKRIEVALACLPEDVQIRALARLEQSAVGSGQSAATEEATTGTEYDRACATDKAEADRRLDLLRKRDQFLSTNPTLAKVAALSRFVNTIRESGVQTVSTASLYAWDAAYAARGIDGLLPGYRGGRPTTISPADRGLFLSCWGQEQQPTTASAYRAFLILRQREDEADEPPTIHAFRYLVENLSEEEQIALRRGPKAMRQALFPYIQRDYESILPLDWYCMDHSPLDILALDPDGKVCRPYLTANMDLRTRRVCITVVKSPNQNTVLYTLAKSILAWGVPRNLYIDNGKDFRAHAVTGGKAKKVRLELNEGRCLSLCDKLGIKAYFAEAFNAQAKPIERFFRTLEGDIAILFETYVGRSPVHKPEALKDAVKAGPIPTFAEVEKIVTGWIEGTYHAAAHTGHGMNGRSPDQVWAELLPQVERRTATREQLKYLLLKTPEPVTVSRYQVRLFGRFYEAAPESPDCLFGLHNQKVVPHYDPEDVTRIFLTKEDDTPVGWVIEKRLAPFGPVAEEVIAQSKRTQKRVRAALRSFHADAAAARIEPDPVVRELARRGDRPRVGTLMPSTPPGQRSNVAQIIPLSPAMRAAAEMAAEPPARKLVQTSAPDDLFDPEPRRAAASAGPSYNDVLNDILEDS